MSRRPIVVAEFLLRRVKVGQSRARLVQKLLVRDTVLEELGEELLRVEVDLLAAQSIMRYAEHLEARRRYV